MKFLSNKVCGVLLGGALLATNVLAQSTTSGTAGKTQSPPNAPAQGSPSNRPISTLTPGTPPPPVGPPITLEQTRQLLALMDYKKIEDGNWSQMITMNRKAAPFIPEDVWTDVQTNINTIDYPTLMQPIYAKYLSQADAAKALEFYSTPAGKRVLQAMPPLLGESVAASQQKGRELGRQAIEKHRTEIEAAQKKYQAEHAPQTAPAPGAGSASPAQPTSPSTTPAPATPPPSTAKPQR
jgi:Uncharacterized protein conserved in bacteria (DUF2059)